MIRTTDVAITTAADSQPDTVRGNIRALLELKKPRSLEEKNHTPEVVCENLAASYLNMDFPVFSVLTDLNESWRFFWFAEATDDVKQKICVYKLELSGQTAGADAKRLLESLFSGSAPAPSALPTTFAHRLSFRAVLKSLANESVNGRKRVKFNHDDGVLPDQDSKNLPSTGQDKDQSSGSGLISSSAGGGGTLHQNNQGSATLGELLL